MTRRSIRLTAMAVSFVFTWTTVLGSTPAYAQAIHANPLASIGEVSGLGDYLPALDIPADLGQVREYYQPSQYAGSGKPFVIHLQDAHANPDAQQSIKKILSWLKDHQEAEGKSLTVALEGADDTIHPEYLDMFPEYPEVNQAIVDDLASKGELTGAELFAWEQYRSGADQGTVRYVGVEDADVYRENLSTYRDVLFRQDEINALLEVTRENLELAQSRVLNPELRKFIRERQRRKLGDYGNDNSAPQLLAYLNFLSGRVFEELQIDLNNRFEQIRFPHFVRALVLGELEKVIDIAKAQIETEKVFEKLEGVAKTAKEKELVDAFRHLQTHKAARHVAEETWSFARAKRLDLNAYREFWKSIGATILRQEVEATELFGEMAQLETWLIDKLAGRDAEKELIEILDRFIMLEKLVGLKLTRDDYKTVVPNHGAILESVLGGRTERLIEEHGNGIKPEAATDRFARHAAIETFAASALSFYKQAEERDRILIEKTLAATSENDITVLITGGFHTSGLAEVMKEENIGYAVVQPRIRQSDGGRLYHQVLREENADLSAYFEESFLSVQEALYLKSVLTVGVVNLWEKYEMPHSEIGGVIARAINGHEILSETLDAQAKTAAGGSAMELRPSIEDRPASASMDDGVPVEGRAIVVALRTLAREAFTRVYAGRQAAADRRSVQPIVITFVPAGVETIVRTSAYEPPDRSELRTEEKISRRELFRRAGDAAKLAVAAKVAAAITFVGALTPGLAAGQDLEQLGRELRVLIGDARRTVDRRTAIRNLFTERRTGNRGLTGSSLVYRAEAGQVLTTAEHYRLTQESPSGFIQAFNQDRAEAVISRALVIKEMRDARATREPNLTGDRLGREFFFRNAVMAIAEHVITEEKFEFPEERPGRPGEVNILTQLDIYDIVETAEPLMRDSAPQYFLNTREPEYQFIRLLIKLKLLRRPDFPTFVSKLRDYRDLTKATQEEREDAAQGDLVHIIATNLGLNLPLRYKLKEDGTFELDEEGKRIPEDYQPVKLYETGDGRAMRDRWVKDDGSGRGANVDITVGEVIAILSVQKATYDVAGPVFQQILNRINSYVKDTLTARDRRTLEIDLDTFDTVSLFENPVGDGEVGYIVNETNRLQAEIRNAAREALITNDAQPYVTARDNYIRHISNIPLILERSLLEQNPKFAELLKKTAAFPLNKNLAADFASRNVEIGRHPDILRRERILRSIGLLRSELRLSEENQDRLTLAGTAGSGLLFLAVGLFATWFAVQPALPPTSPSSLLKLDRPLVERGQFFDDPDQPIQPVQAPVYEPRISLRPEDLITSPAELEAQAARNRAAVDALADRQRELSDLLTQREKAIRTGEQVVVGHLPARSELRSKLDSFMLAAAKVLYGPQTPRPQGVSDSDRLAQIAYWHYAAGPLSGLDRFMLRAAQVLYGPRSRSELREVTVGEARRIAINVVRSFIDGSAERRFPGVELSVRDNGVLFPNGPINFALIKSPSEVLRLLEANPNSMLTFRDTQVFSNDGEHIPQSPLTLFLTATNSEAPDQEGLETAVDGLQHFDPELLDLLHDLRRLPDPEQFAQPRPEPHVPILVPALFAAFFVGLLAVAAFRLLPLDTQLTTDEAVPAVNAVEESRHESKLAAIRALGKALTSERQAAIEELQGLLSEEYSIQSMYVRSRRTDEQGYRDSQERFTAIQAALTSLGVRSELRSAVAPDFSEANVLNDLVDLYTRNALVSDVPAEAKSRLTDVTRAHYLEVARLADDRVKVAERFKQLGFDSEKTAALVRKAIEQLNHFLDGFATEQTYTNLTELMQRQEKKSSEFLTRLLVFAGIPTVIGPLSGFLAAVRIASAAVGAVLTVPYWIAGISAFLTVTGVIAFVIGLHRFSVKNADDLAARKALRRELVSQNLDVDRSELRYEVTEEVEEWARQLAELKHVISLDQPKEIDMRRGGLLPLLIKHRIIHSVTTNNNSNFDYIDEIQKLAKAAGRKNPLTEAIEDILRKTAALRGADKRGEVVKLAYEKLINSFVAKIALALLPIYEESQGRHGFVSTELPTEIVTAEGPDEAALVAAIVAAGQKRLAATRREIALLGGKETQRNIFLKIPATSIGLKAGEELQALGYNVNYTLVATGEQYEATVVAHKNGVRRFVESYITANGQTSADELARLIPQSVSSDFVSRDDRNVAPLLEDESFNAIIAHIEKVRDSLDQSTQSERHAHLVNQIANYRRLQLLTADQRLTDDDYQQAIALFRELRLNGPERVVNTTKAALAFAQANIGGIWKQHFEKDGEWNSFVARHFSDYSLTGNTLDLLSQQVYWASTGVKVDGKYQTDAFYLKGVVEKYTTNTTPRDVIVAILESGKAPFEPQLITSLDRENARDALDKLAALGVELGYIKNVIIFPEGLEQFQGSDTKSYALIAANYDRAAANFERESTKVLQESGLPTIPGEALSYTLDALKITKTAAARTVTFEHFILESTFTDGKKGGNTRHVFSGYGMTPWVMDKEGNDLQRDHKAVLAEMEYGFDSKGVAYRDGVLNGNAYNQRKTKTKIAEQLKKYGTPTVESFPELTVASDYLSALGKQVSPIPTVVVYDSDDIVTFGAALLVEDGERKIVFERAFVNEIDAKGNPYQMLTRTFVYLLNADTHEQNRIVEYDYARSVDADVSSKQRVNIETVYQNLVLDNIKEDGSPEDAAMASEIKRKLQESLWEIGVHFLNGDISNDLSKQRLRWHELPAGENDKVDFGYDFVPPFTENNENTGDVSVGIIATMAYPLHVGQYEPAFRMMAQNKLDVMGFFLHGVDYRKAGTGSPQVFAERRETVRKFVELSGGLIEYSTIEEQSELDGESKTQKFIPLNAGRRGKLKILYLASGDHAHIFAPNFKELQKTGDYVPTYDGADPRRDVVIKWEQWKAENAQLLVDSGIEVVSVVPTFNIREFFEMLPLPLESEDLLAAYNEGRFIMLDHVNLLGTSSTDIRNFFSGAAAGHIAYLPTFAADDIAKSGKLRGWIIQLPDVIDRLAALGAPADANEKDIQLFSRWIHREIDNGVTPTVEELSDIFRKEADKPLDPEVASKALAAVLDHPLNESAPWKSVVEFRSELRDETHFALNVLGLKIASDITGDDTLIITPLAAMEEYQTFPPDTAKTRVLDSAIGSEIDDGIYVAVGRKGPGDAAESITETSFSFIAKIGYPDLSKIQDGELAERARQVLETDRKWMFLQFEPDLLAELVAAGLPRREVELWVNRDKVVEDGAFAAQFAESFEKLSQVLGPNRTTYVYGKSTIETVDFKYFDGSFHKLTVVTRSELRSVDDIINFLKGAAHPSILSIPQGVEPLHELLESFIPSRLLEPSRHLRVIEPDDRSRTVMDALEVRLTQGVLPQGEMLLATLRISDGRIDGGSGNLLSLDFGVRSDFSGEAIQWIEAVEEVEAAVRAFGARAGYSTLSSRGVNFSLLEDADVFRVRNREIPRAVISSVRIVDGNIVISIDGDPIPLEAETAGAVELDLKDIISIEPSEDGYVVIIRVGQTHKVLNATDIDGIIRAAEEARLARLEKPVSRALSAGLRFQELVAAHRAETSALLSSLLPLALVRSDRSVEVYDPTSPYAQARLEGWYVVLRQGDTVVLEVNVDDVGPAADSPHPVLFTSVESPFDFAGEPLTYEQAVKIVVAKLGHLASRSNYRVLNVTSDLLSRPYDIRLDRSELRTERHEQFLNTSLRAFVDYLGLKALDEELLVTGVASEITPRVSLSSRRLDTLYDVIGPNKPVAKLRGSQSFKRSFDLYLEKLDDSVDDTSKLVIALPDTEYQLRVVTQNRVEPVPSIFGSNAGSIREQIKFFSVINRLTQVGKGDLFTKHLGDENAPYFDVLRKVREIYMNENGRGTNDQIILNDSTLTFGLFEGRLSQALKTSAGFDGVDAKAVIKQLKVAVDRFIDLNDLAVELLISALERGDVSREDAKILLFLQQLGAGVVSEEVVRGIKEGAVVRNYGKYQFGFQYNPGRAKRGGTFATRTIGSLPETILSRPYIDDYFPLQRFLPYIGPDGVLWREQANPYPHQPNSMNAVHDHIALQVAQVEDIESRLLNLKTNVPAGERTRFRDFLNVAFSGFTIPHLHYQGYLKQSNAEKALAQPDALEELHVDDKGVKYSQVNDKAFKKNQGFPLRSTLVVEGSDALATAEGVIKILSQANEDGSLVLTPNSKFTYNLLLTYDGANFRVFIFTKKIFKNPFISDPNHPAALYEPDLLVYTNENDKRSEVSQLKSLIATAQKSKSQEIITDLTALGVKQAIIDQASAGAHRNVVGGLIAYGFETGLILFSGRPAGVEVTDSLIFGDPSQGAAFARIKADISLQDHVIRQVFQQIRYGGFKELADTIRSGFQRSELRAQSWKAGGGRIAIRVGNRTEYVRPNSREVARVLRDLGGNAHVDGTGKVSVQSGNRRSSVSPDDTRGIEDATRSELRSAFDYDEAIRDITNPSKETRAAALSRLNGWATQAGLQSHLRDTVLDASLTAEEHRSNALEAHGQTLDTGIDILYAASQSLNRVIEDDEKPELLALITEVARVGRTVAERIISRVNEYDATESAQLKADLYEPLRQRIEAIADKLPRRPATAYDAVTYGLLHRIEDLKPGITLTVQQPEGTNVVDPKADTATNAGDTTTLEGDAGRSELRDSRSDNPVAQLRPIDATRGVSTAAANRSAQQLTTNVVLAVALSAQLVAIAEESAGLYQTVQNLAGELNISELEALALLLRTINGSAFENREKANLVLDTAKAALGPFADLLEGHTDSAVHLLESPTGTEIEDDTTLILLAVMLMANPQDRFSLFLPTDADERKFGAALRQTLTNLGATAKLADQVHLEVLASSSTLELVRQVRRAAGGRNKNDETALIGESDELERVGYSNVARVDKGQVLPLATALLITADLLRGSLLNKRTIIQLEIEMKRQGYTAEVITYVTTMIQAVRRLAVAA